MRTESFKVVSGRVELIFRFRSHTRKEYSSDVVPMWKNNSVCCCIWGLAGLLKEHLMNPSPADCHRTQPCGTPLPRNWASRMERLP